MTKIIKSGFEVKPENIIASDNYFSNTPKSKEIKQNRDYIFTISSDIIKKIKETKINGEAVTQIGLVQLFVPSQSIKCKGTGEVEITCEIKKQLYLDGEGGEGQTPPYYSKSSYTSDNENKNIFINDSPSFNYGIYLEEINPVPKGRWDDKERTVCPQIVTDVQHKIDFFVFLLINNKFFFNDYWHWGFDVVLNVGSKQIEHVITSSENKNIGYLTRSLENLENYFNELEFDPKIIDDLKKCIDDPDQLTNLPTNLNAKLRKI
ncbi:hypothetical protein SD427_14430 [Chryseobacterium sp. JJR-5R]|uniref:hypothetical protein n=1 Tax=Chryseobacterium sp. JJR-5R TaxID=3093923 RepID=UPI002A74FA93|nr:hypothetical protein [Chryseobacterium sp. JJR-5R]WPO81957.1 hypothetical protein SD427_14430 [Chryseobacterium sp. JJR-5R]